MVHLVNFAVMKDAPIKQRREEYVSDMGQRNIFAVMKDVKIKQRRGEYAFDMVQRYSAKRANMKNVPIMSSMEECVSGMVLTRSCAVIEDVQTKSRREEYVLGMVQSNSVKLAVTKDAPTLPLSREEYVEGTV